MNMSERDEFPRLSAKESLILELLVDRGEMFGLEMVEASGGLLKRGTIYVTLQRMQEKKYVESRAEQRIEPEAGRARRKYTATGLGERAYITNVKAREFFNADLVLKEAG